MKKQVLFVSAFVLSMVLVSCGGNKVDETEMNVETPVVIENEDTTTVEETPELVEEVKTETTKTTTKTTTTPDRKIEKTKTSTSKQVESDVKTTLQKNSQSTAEIKESLKEIEPESVKSTRKKSGE